MNPAPPGLVHFRSVFISDIHLGAKTSRPAALLEFLKAVESGKLYLVGVVLYAKWLAHLGDRACKTAIWINQRFNKLRRVVGLPCWSLSAYLKCNVKRAVEFISNLEQAVVRAARSRHGRGIGFYGQVAVRA